MNFLGPVQSSKQPGNSKSNNNNKIAANIIVTKDFLSRVLNCHQLSFFYLLYYFRNTSGLENPHLLLLACNRCNLVSQIFPQYYFFRFYFFLSRSSIAGCPLLPIFQKSNIHFIHHIPPRRERNNQAHGIWLCPIRQIQLSI